MPYSKLLQRSLDVVRREPALWVMGFLLALFGGGSGFSFSGNWGDQSNWGDDTFQWEGAPPALPEWLTAETAAVVGGVLLCGVLVLGVLALVVQSIALTGLITGAASAAQGEDVGWGALWRQGASRAGRRVLGLKLLLLLPTLLGLLLGIIAFAIALLPLIQSAWRGSPPDGAAWAGVVGMALIALPVALVLALITILLNLIAHYAARAVVLDGQPLGAALRQGWDLFRHNVAATIVLAVMLGVIGGVAGLLIGFVIVFLALLLGVPLALLLASQSFPLLPTLLSGGVVLLLLMLTAALLNGPLLAFYETAWTLAWEHLRGSTPSEELLVATEI